jgi:DNA-binding protein H-NS
MTELTELTTEQLQQRLEQLTEEWNAVKAAMERREAKEKEELAQLVRKKIEAAGFAVDEIATLVRGRRTGRRGSGLGGSGNYVDIVWVDPGDAGNVYVRGPLPSWMREKMTAAGFDPAHKDHRDAFKQQHLIRQ